MTPIIAATATASPSSAPTIQIRAAGWPLSFFALLHQAFSARMYHPGGLDLIGGLDGTVSPYGAPTMMRIQTPMDLQPNVVYLPFLSGDTGP